MSRRNRVILLVVITVAFLLFLGRWTTVMVAERWWAGTISPEVRAFVGQVQVLRLVLDVVGSLFAAAWFVANFYVVYRAIGSVHVSRRVANLEINEALTPRVLLIGTVSAGVLLGLLTGLGASQWWQNVLLAWNGVTYGIVDPIMGRDLGLYVAQLPLWRRAHNAALILVLLGLGICFLLYVLVGAIRWSGRRPALTDHVRRHLGWLLAALALVLAWGYWLEPYETVAGLGAAVRLDTAEFHSVVANALTGVGLAAALVSAIWALRPRHLLMAMAWMILAFSSIIGHHVLPAFSGARERSIVDSEEGIKRLERLAFAMTRLDTIQAIAPGARMVPPGPVSLWSTDQVVRLGEGDSSVLASVNQSSLSLRGRRLPIWVTLRVLQGDSAVVSGYADDRVSLSGGPLSYRLADTLAYPGTVRLLDLPPHSVRPRAPDYRVTQDTAGVPVNSWMRRLVLAWARQAGSLFQSLPTGSFLAWHLEPLGRLQAAGPHIAWGTPTAHLVDDELYWLAEGYVTSATFPIVDRVSWRDRDIAAIDVPFLGTINARTGETRMYRRPSAGPLGRAWQDILGDGSLPWSAVPPGIQEVLTYPEELFQIQSRVLEKPHWLGQRLAAPAADLANAVMPTAWRQRDTTLLRVAVFEGTGSRGVTAVLVGHHAGPQPRLFVSPIRDNEGFGASRALDRNWKRFATFEQLRDSLRSVNSEAEYSPIKIWVEPHGVGAYQVVYGKGPERQLAVAWVNLAARDSLGAGRTLQEAWQNLLGMSAPLLSGGFGGRLGEARQWMAIADSALKRGDWSAFGRAFEALREVLKAEE